MSSLGRRYSASRSQLNSQRWVVIILDCSKFVRRTDLSRVIRCLESFMDYFFENNPLSQIQVLMTSDGGSHRVSHMGGNSDSHTCELKKLLNENGENSRVFKGFVSLQNSLLLAIKSLKNLPLYGYKQVLFILFSLQTQDPGNIFSTLQLAKKQRISISIIHMEAEMQVCRRITRETNGLFSVPVNDNHFVTLLKRFGSSEYLQTVDEGDMANQTYGTLQQLVSDLIPVGFPTLEMKGVESGRRPLYAISCPRCLNEIQNPSLPLNCPICLVLLLKFSHLIRSYYHFVPRPKFHPISDLKELSNFKKNANAIDGNDALGIFTGVGDESSPEESLLGFRCHSCLKEVALSDRDSDNRKTDAPDPFPALEGVLDNCELEQNYKALYEDESKTRYRLYVCDTCHSYFCCDCYDLQQNYLYQCSICLEKDS